MTIIILNAADARRAQNYGVMFESARYDVKGPGLHNPSFSHVVEIWQNRNGIDPEGNPTEASHTFMLSAKPTMIANTPTDHVFADETLTVGEVVTLALGGPELTIGEFRIEARRLADPVLVRVS